MKFLFVFFMGCSLFSKAHSDKYVYFQEKNLFIEYRTGFNESEINQQFKILKHLATEYLKRNNPNNEVVYLNFLHDNFQSDSNYCAVSYGDFIFDDYRKKNKITSRGIRIILSAQVLNIQEILCLISSSLKNVNFIKKNQKQFIRDEHMTINGVHQYDTLESISHKVIKDFQERLDPKLKQLIGSKTYSKSVGRDYYWRIEYYYQNNKFHIYNTSSPKTKYNRRTGNEDTIQTYGEDILVVSQINQIIGDYFGAIIFTNDSVFYFIPQSTDENSGPFYLDSIVRGRAPVHKFHYEYYDSCIRVTMYFDNFINYTKAVFIPVKELLINNYHLLENKLVRDVLKGEKETPKKTNKTLWVIILSLLLISLIFNYRQFRKNRKNT